MKSEHRHDLQTNYLSAGLARWIDKVKPFTGQIITGMVLLAILYAGLSFWDAQTAQQERAAWDAYAYATDTRDPELEKLQRIASNEEFAGTKMQEWAYVSWADRQVLNAMGSYLYEREKTQDRLRNVTGVYEGLASSASDPQVLNRARFGLGRVYELENKLDEARQQYLLVRGDLQPLASERAKQLESDKVREACSWLATAELPKRDLTGGQGATGTRPGFDATLPAAKASADAITAESLEELLGEPNSDSPEEDSTGEKEQAASSDNGGESPAEKETNNDTADTADEDTADEDPAKKDTAPE